MTPQPGQFVHVDEHPYSHFQVINVDADKGNCWVRRWPLSRKGSPAFSVSLQQLKQAEIKSGLAL